MEFITNYAGVFGLSMPAAPRGRANTVPTYLPSSCSFQSVWTLYCQAQKGDEETMGYHTFLRLWHRKLPSIVIMIPRINVCARCKRLRNEMRNAGLEQDKLQTASELKSHVELAQSERDFYKSCISRAKPSQKHLSTSHLTSRKTLAYPTMHSSQARYTSKFYFE